MRILFLAVALMAVTLAGCAEEPNDVVEDPASFDQFDATATDTTGVIRGIVVDSTITPVPDVTITLDDTLSVESAEDGAFAFGDVDPGVHVLEIDGIGYVKTSTTVEVEAGVDQPEIVKVLLERDESELPYFEAFTFNGFIQCSGSTPAYRVAICGAVNTVFDILGQAEPLDDEFMTGFAIDTYPDWVQAEMVWESTQPLGDQMTLTVEVSATDGADIGNAAGPSPLVVSADNATIAAAGMDTSGWMQQRVFNMEHPLTTPPVPVCDIPNPVHGGTMCAKGVGMTLDQKFEVFTHNFHGFLPPEGWMFIEQGTPVAPS